MAVGYDGSVFAVGSHGSGPSTIHIFSPGVLRFSTQSLEGFDSQMHLVGIAIDYDQRILLASQETNSILIHKLVNSEKYQYERDGEIPLPKGVRPVSLAIVNGGKIIVSTPENTLIELSREGKHLTTFEIEGKKDLTPLGIAADNDGNIYVADRDHDRIQVFNAEGKHLRQFGGAESFHGSNQYLNDPGHLAIDKKGNVAVVDTGNHRVVIFNPSGIMINSFFVDYGPLGYRVPYKVTPRGIGVNSEGEIFIAYKEPYGCGIIRYEVTPEADVNKLYEYVETKGTLVMTDLKPTAKTEFLQHLCAKEPRTDHLIDMIRSIDYEKKEKSNEDEKLSSGLQDSFPLIRGSGDRKPDSSGLKASPVKRQGALKKRNRVKLLVDNSAASPPGIIPDPSSAFAPANISESIAAGLSLFDGPKPFPILPPPETEHPTLVTSPLLLTSSPPSHPNHSHHNNLMQALTLLFQEIDTISQFQNK